jgi:prepilin-type N-terminal cleavage/methylation domain-containing protein/prepilin-type processing-associated H-X9-DG protein
MLPKRSLIRAFTLIELLVVIAIIGVLVALLVPAIQKVRAAAANSQCVNNMKQIGLAVLGYHDVNKCFPAGAWNQPWGWMFDILPFIEQDAIHKQGLQDFDLTVATNIIATYLCPADPRENAGWLAQTTTSSVRHLGVPVGHPLRYGRTSYLGVLGKEFPTQVTGINYGDGVFGGWGDADFSDPSRRIGKIKLDDVTDGTSNTVMVGERPPGPNDDDFIGETWAWGAWLGWIGDNMLWAIVDTNSSFFIYDCPGQYYFSQGDLKNKCHTNHFWSFHNGGGNWLLCDGSVRFMSYSAGTEIIPPMATINGGEILPPID